MDAKIYRVNGKTEKVIPNNGYQFDLDEVGTLLGGYISINRLSNGQYVITKEGAEHNSPFNKRATEYATKMSGRSMMIFGDALICNCRLFH